MPASRCDHAACLAWAPYGWTSPPGHEPPKRPLRACSEHREWAEARWRDKYHRGTGRADAPQQRGAEAAIHDGPRGAQPLLF